MKIGNSHRKLEQEALCNGITWSNHFFLLHYIKQVLRGTVFGIDLRSGWCRCQNKNSALLAQSSCSHHVILPLGYWRNWGNQYAVWLHLPFHLSCLSFLLLIYTLGLLSTLCDSYEGEKRALGNYLALTVYSVNAKYHLQEWITQILWDGNS